MTIITRLPANRNLHTHGCHVYIEEPLPRLMRQDLDTEILAACRGMYAHSPGFDPPSGESVLIVESPTEYAEVPQTMSLRCPDCGEGVAIATLVGVEIYTGMPGGYFCRMRIVWQLEHNCADGPDNYMLDADHDFVKACQTELDCRCACGCRGLFEFKADAWQETRCPDCRYKCQTTQAATGVKRGRKE